MKMTKKVLLATVVAAAVLVTACKEVIGDVEWKKVNEGNQTVVYKVNQTNENDRVIRGAKSVGIMDRAGGSCVITLNDQDSTKKDGVAGFIYGLEKNKDTGTIDFMSIGVQNEKGKIRYYASLFFNIDPNNLSAENFGASKTRNTYDPELKDPYEVIVTAVGNNNGDVGNPTSNEYGWEQLNIWDDCYTPSDKTVKLAIDVKTHTDGSYEYWIYKKDTFSIKSGDHAAGAFDFSGKSSAHGKVSKEINGRSSDVKGGIYTYANIQPNKTLNAKWEVYNITSKTTPANANIRAAADLEEDFSCGEVIFE